VREGTVQQLYGIIDKIGMVKTMVRKSHGGIADKKREWLMERGYTYDPKTGIRLGITGKVGSKDKHEQAYLKQTHQKPHIMGPPHRTVGKGPVVLPKPKSGYSYVFPRGNDGKPKANEYTGATKLHGQRLQGGRTERFAGPVRDGKPIMTPTRRAYLMERGYTWDPWSGKKLGITGKVGSKQKHEQAYIKSGRGKFKTPYMWGWGIPHPIMFFRDLLDKQRRKHKYASEGGFFAAPHNPLSDYCAKHCQHHGQQ